MFFSGRGGGGKRQRQDTFSSGQCLLDDTRCQTDPFFYVVYYIFSGGGFAVSYFRPSGTVSPDARYPGQTRTLLTMWGPVTLRSGTDSTEQLVWCLMHM
jgi:hypothetical protein